MNEIILYHHLGLGDHFICNGLVNKLSEKYDKIYIPCKQHYFESVYCLYSENFKVEVFPILNEPYDVYKYSNDNNLNVMLVGFLDFCANTFEQSFYKSVDLDYSVRYNHFKLPKHIENSKSLYDKLVKTIPYCVIHENSSDKDFTLDINSDLEKIYIKFGQTSNILDYIEILKNAEEIHCVGSSIYALVDSIDVKAKLYYHNNRLSGTNEELSLTDRWNKVEY